MSERESTSRGSSRQREKQAPHRARSHMRDLIPGPWDHDLSWRQMLNWLSYLGALQPIIFILNAYLLQNIMLPDLCILFLLFTKFLNIRKVGIFISPWLEWKLEFWSIRSMCQKHFNHKFPLRPLLIAICFQYLKFLYLAFPVYSLYKVMK